MPFFFADNLDQTAKTLTISGEEFHHVSRVFRKQIGDSLTVTNGRGLLASGQVAEIRRSECVLKIASVQSIERRPESAMRIALGLIRPNRMDWAVEKLTELGVGKIQPLKTEFTDVKVFKADHLRKVSIAALKQSEQAWLPEIAEPRNYMDWLQNVKDGQAGTYFLADGSGELNSATLAKRIIATPTIFAIGPEGGFSNAELAAARESGFQIVKLGSQILRTETAAVVAASLLKSATD